MRPRDAKQQLTLFDLSEPPDDSRLPPIGPATPPPELIATAQQLSPLVYLGTSSWSFPGWHGLVFDRLASEAQLARTGLRAYAQHPLLRVVGIDRTYYAPIAAAQFAEYAAAVPPAFRFLVKAHELCMMPRFTRGNRQGASAGTPNPAFLDAEYAVERVIRPALEGLGEALGPIVFQFSPLRLAQVGGPNALIERLGEFLSELPRGPLYAVEIRNRELLTARYAKMLRATQSQHCFAVHPSMPVISEQVSLLGERAAGATVVRWMLGGDQAYEQARERYAPFDQLVDEDPANRDAIATLALDAIAKKTPIYTIANNKAEGSAPRTVFKLAERIVERLPVS